MLCSRGVHWVGGRPDNPHDSLAIGVWNADRTLKVGRAPAVVVAGLAANDRLASRRSTVRHVR